MKRIVSIVLEILVNVIVSIVLIGILGQVLSLTTYEQIVIGALFFLCTMSIWLRYDLIRIVKDSEEIFKDRSVLLKTLNQINLFEGLNPSLRKISDHIQILSERYGRDDLFVYWYSKKIEQLLSHLKHTIDTESFDFDQSMTAERPRILNILKKRKPSFFWALASCRSIPHFADPDGATFLRQVDKMLHDREITEVRRLFLFDDKCELDAINTQILFLLHEKNGYKYRAISQGDFDTIFKNFRDKSMTKDFGIWGNSFVWETPEQNILTQEGFMCRNSVRINQYKQLYEELWEASEIRKISEPNLIDIVKNYSIDQFREVLAIYERSHK